MLRFAEKSEHVPDPYRFSLNDKVGIGDVVLVVVVVEFEIEDAVFPVVKQVLPDQFETPAEFAAKMSKQYW